MWHPDWPQVDSKPASFRVEKAGVDTSQLGVGNLAVVVLDRELVLERATNPMIADLSSDSFGEIRSHVMKRKVSGRNANILIIFLSVPTNDADSLYLNLLREDK